MNMDRLRGRLIKLTELLGVFLTATHIISRESVSFALDDGIVTLGRASSEDPAGKLPIEFDPSLSRRAVVLKVQGQQLEVSRDQSRHPLFFEGEELEKFILLPGQRFTSGQTLFELHSQQAQTLTLQAVERSKQKNSAKILEVLLRFQPLLVSQTELSNLFQESVSLLQELLPNSRVAFFSVPLSGEPKALTQMLFKPSGRLLAECMDQRLPVYHFWTANIHSSQPTQSNGESWALACPIDGGSQQFVLYAVGQQDQPELGELERSALALVAQFLAQHLQSRESVRLAARVESQTEINNKLRLLLSTVEQSVALEQEKGFQKLLLDAAKELTQSGIAHFELDLSYLISEGDWHFRGEDSEGFCLAICFEDSWPEGLLCRRDSGPAYSEEDLQWLAALARFTETVFENRRLHSQVSSSLSKLKDNQGRMLRSVQWAAAGRMAANAAHELNTPLGAIKLSAEATLAFLDSNQKPAHESIKLLLRAVERCQKVTERFLVYSRPKEKKEIEAFQLSVVIEDALSSLSPYFKSKAIQIIQDDLTANIQGDSQDLYWALANVLRNAVDAFPEVQKERQIILTLEREEQQFILRVEDNGPGVPPSLQAKIFDPFFSTKKIGQGNGLGLAISRRGLRSWNGDLLLEDSSEEGASFVFCLPRA